MNRYRKSLLGINDELDNAVLDIASLSHRYMEMYPAAGGDVSQVFSSRASSELRQIFGREASGWFSIRTLERMSSIRKDGRSGYRTEGIKHASFYEEVRVLGRRVLLITCTGSQLPAILETVRRNRSGRYFNLMELSADARSVRVLYGNREFGSIPSIELHVHLLAAAMSVHEGNDHPGVVHAHPYHCTRLGMHPQVCGDYARFNAVIYSQVEGLNRNVPRLIGVIPYAPSGSATLVQRTEEALRNHEVVLWMNHGVIARSFRVERAYSLLAYAEQGARAALDYLRDGGCGLPRSVVQGVLTDKIVLSAYRKCFARKNKKPTPTR